MKEIYVFYKDYMMPKSEWDALQREKKLGDLGI
jgi:hypothetical protein